jgi:TolA-binding protein/peroxiredoxin
MRRLTTLVPMLFAMAALSARTVVLAAEAPSPAQALALTPIQPNVEYTIPTKEEAAQCTIKPEKENNITSWVVRNHDGEILRRFADTNGDNVVDEWCYFQNGAEVYRDIDSNFKGKADQYRWFNTAGTRWGMDKNEDGKIDSWKVISPHEVAEQIVLAIKNNDPARFELALLTPSELNGLGFGKARQESIAASLKDAPAAFSKLVTEQKIVTPQTRYVDFGSARPGTIPSGTDGSTKDITVLDNAAALVQTNNKHEQVFLGTLVQVGDTWKLIAAPSDNQGQNGMLTQSSPAPGAVGGDQAPSDEMQAQMKILEELDKKAEAAQGSEAADDVKKRLTALKSLADASQGPTRDQWYRQMIDILGVAIQNGTLNNGTDLLAQLQKELESAKADEDLIAHAAFQNMWSQFAVNQRAPNANMQTLQDQWQTDLKTFVEQHPKSSDAAEALLQLGMYQEFMGKTDDATKWYQQLAKSFPDAKQAQRATGALRRINALGKPMTLAGKDLQNAQIDVASKQYRGKAVLIQYWATWCEPCKADMVMLKDYYDKHAGKDFDIISVCLDDNASAAKQFWAQNKYPWKTIFEPGGLDGRLANEMGVMTLPLMILVDQRGNVTNTNIHVAELDTELAKLITKPAANSAGTANALRSPPTSR